LISKFIEIAFYLSLSLSVISKSLAQPWCKCCSLSVSIVLNVRFTTNGMCMMNNAHVARTSRNQMITTSVATSDVLTSDLICSEKFLMSDVLATNLMLTGLLLLFPTFPILSGWKQIRFAIF